MARYVEINAKDRLEVVDRYVEIDVTTNSIDVSRNYQEVGSKNSYKITPYNGFARAEYVVPEYVTGGLAGIATLQNDLLDKLNGVEVAELIDQSYVDKLNYDPNSDLTLREQIRGDLDGYYISNGSDGTAHILSFDYADARINTVYDINGNPVYEESSLFNLRNDLAATKEGQASVIEVNQAISTWENSYASTISNLNATYKDLTTNVNNSAFAQAGTGDVIAWTNRNDLVNEDPEDPESPLIKLAKGGDLSYNPNKNKWYQYLGGTFGTFSDGWIVAEGSTLWESLKGTADFTESETVPSNPKPFDIWLQTDAVSSFDATKSKVWQYLGYDASLNDFSWQEVDPAKPAASWLSGFSRIITGDNGAVTGFSVSDGQYYPSSFKINADNFEIWDSTNSTKPFIVDATDPINPKTKFIGLVEFGILDENGNPYTNESTAIRGDVISTGNIKSNEVAASTGDPITKLDLDNGRFEVRDAQGRLRVKIGKLT
jgi:hypothetical protein